MFDIQKEIEKIKQRMREIENGSEETYYKEYHSLSREYGNLKGTLEDRLKVNPCDRKVTDGCLFQE